MFQCLVELSKQRAMSPVRGPNAKEEGIVFATDTSQKRPTRRPGTPKDPVHFVRVRIGSVVAEKAGLKAGDKVTLRWDKASRIGLILKHDEGRALTGLKRAKEEGKPVEGPQALQLRFTWQYGYPSIYEPKLREAVVINGDLGDTTLQFVFPEGTSFDKLATAPKAGEDPIGQVIQYNRRSTDRQAVA